MRPPPDIDPTQRPTPRPAPRGGFTFVEVLFAIIILGVGLIMVAAMLPVAIQQSQLAATDVTARVLTDSAYAQVRAVASRANFGTRDTGGRMEWVYLNNPTGTPPFQQLAGNSVSSIDPRFAWVLFWQRESATSPLIRIVAVALQRQSEENPFYRVGTPLWNGQGDGWPPGSLSSLAGTPGQIIDGGADPLAPDRIVFDPSSATADVDDPRLRAAPGALVVVRSSVDPANNGRVFRLANRIDVNTWALDPTADLPPRSDGSPDPTLQGPNHTFWIIGRGLRNPFNFFSSSGNPFEGLAQEIGFATYTIQLR